MNITKEIDAKGLSCPMPIVRAKKGIDEINTGEVLQLVTTDKGSQTDVKAWTEATGHKLLEMKEEDGVFSFWIEKA
ncbi:TusA-related sulfurtransferase [Oikeobacillus pervagus]|uniref:TusA-related sulfurtransferase n=1 Tax=Oikeobacillus pervagus TaxID=1325931 RepID=A0AAJ1T4X3_9BACI|nr:sulfurtransferase TusA family protein [Oikeobacillus pervagus]MDQ0215934.1 TusA-related sulfurtransferase [Oikeobacillus pervagus]